uniref:Rubredoxin n=1 Tax=Desertifilum tharense IPPAS B-1220 TaxID=1781255 RepID=A0ACD5H0R1_9CYAN
MDSYTCTVCAYVYNPEDGDPDAEIDPGTDFDSLPEDWVCPVCGYSKAEFEVVE